MTDYTTNDSTEAIPLEVRCQLAQSATALAREPVADKPVLMNDLVQFVLGNGRDTQRVERSIESNVTLRRQYLDLVALNSTLSAGRLRAAASKDTISSREGEHFSIRWLQPQEIKDQVYIVLEVDAAAGRQDGDALVLHVYTSSQTATRSFPGLFDGRSQIIVESDDKLLELLSNEDSEIRIV